MRNEGAQYAAMTINKDYDIALEGQRAMREQIYNAQDEQRKDKIEYDKFSEDIAKGMSQFDKLDIHKNDLASVQGIEKNARKVITDALRSHGGDPRAFMRSGGQSMLATYFTQVNNSQEMLNARTSGETYAAANEAITKGFRPNHVNIGSLEAPRLIPFEQAVQMHNQNKLVNEKGEKIPLTWAGSFKPMALNDVIPLLDKVKAENERQLNPQELEGLLLGQGQPDWYAKQVRQQYETLHFDVSKANRLSDKNAYSVGPSRELVMQREAEKNRNLERKLALEKQGEVKYTISPHAERLAPSVLSKLPATQENILSSTTKQTVVRQTILNSEIAPLMTAVPVKTKPSLVWVRIGGSKVLSPLALGGVGGDNGYNPERDLELGKINAEDLSLEESSVLPNAYTIESYGQEITFTSEDRNGRDAKDFAFINPSNGKVMNEGYIQVLLNFPAGKGSKYGGQRKLASDRTQEYDQVVGYIKLDKNAKSAAVAEDARSSVKGYESGSSYIGASQVAPR